MEGLSYLSAPFHQFIHHRDTFAHLGRWLDEARLFASPSIVVTLVGNKADVQSKRQVDRAEAQAFADDNGPHIHC